MTRHSAAGACSMLVWALSVGGLGAGGPHAAGTMLSPSPQAATEEPPKAEQPDAFKRVCVRCHTTDRVVEGRRYRSQWNELIDQMVARGATGSDDEFSVIIEYLVSEFGRVNVNTVRAPELAQVMHLDAAEAEAVVAYRKQHGKFADFAALTAVPGAPVEKLAARRNALIF